MQKSRSKNGMWVHCVGCGRRHYMNEGPCTQGRAKGGLILVIPIVKGITWCINQHFIFIFFPSWYLVRIQRVSIECHGKKKNLRHFIKWNAHRCKHFVFGNTLQVVALYKHSSEYITSLVGGFSSTQKMMISI